MTDPRPPQWEADLAAAYAHLAARHTLPARLWAVYIADVSGLPTYQICRDWKGAFVGFGVTTEFERILAGKTPKGVPTFTLRDTGRRTLNYYAPVRLADQRHQWLHKIGLGRMEEAIRLLEEDEGKQIAWNVAHGYYHALDAPGSPAAVYRGEATLRFAAAQMELPDVAPAPLQRSAEEYAAPILPAEPPEVFEAALRRLERAK